MSQYDGKVKTTVLLKLKPGNVEKLIENIKPNLPGTPGGPVGCISVEIHQEATDPNKILFIEEWESIEIYREHMDSNDTDDMDDFVTKIAEKEPEFDVWKRIL